jgi:hypothetical protein
MGWNINNSMHLNNPNYKKTIFSETDATTTVKAVLKVDVIMQNSVATNKSFF